MVSGDEAEGRNADLDRTYYERVKNNLAFRRLAMDRLGNYVPRMQFTSLAPREEQAAFHEMLRMLGLVSAVNDYDQDLAKTFPINQRVADVVREVTRRTVDGSIGIRAQDGQTIDFPDGGLDTINSISKYLDRVMAGQASSEEEDMLARSCARDETVEEVVIQKLQHWANNAPSAAKRARAREVWASIQAVGIQMMSIDPELQNRRSSSRLRRQRRAAAAGNPAATQTDPRTGAREGQAAATPDTGSPPPRTVPAEGRPGSEARSRTATGGGAAPRSSPPRESRARPAARTPERGEHSDTSTTASAASSGPQPAAGTSGAAAASSGGSSQSRRDPGFSRETKQQMKGFFDKKK